MQTENDYDKEVFNGDLGTIANIDEEEGILTANFDGRDVAYGFGELETTRFLHQVMNASGFTLPRKTIAPSLIQWLSSFS